jgi:hypothetical protein
VSFHFNFVILRFPMYVVTSDLITTLTWFVQVVCESPRFKHKFCSPTTGNQQTVSLTRVTSPLNFHPSMSMSWLNLTIDCDRQTSVILFRTFFFYLRITVEPLLRFEKIETLETLRIVTDFDNSCVVWKYRRGGFVQWEMFFRIWALKLCRFVFSRKTFVAYSICDLCQKKLFEYLRGETLHRPVQLCLWKTYMSSTPNWDS